MIDHAETWIVTILTFAFAVVLWVWFPGCSAVPLPMPPDPNPTLDAGASCAAAGERLATNGCPLAFARDGTPFAVVCAWAIQDGRDWHPDTIALNGGCE